MPNKSLTGVKVFYPRHSRDELISLLRRRLQSLAEVFPLKSAVLFGSWALGNATAFSDIDLLVVYSGEPREDAYRLIWRQLDLRGLQPHIYSEAEAQRMKQVIDRMSRAGVSVFP